MSKRDKTTMKGVNIVCVALVSLLAIGCEIKKPESKSEIDLYPIELDNRMFNDPNAAFDTLSYAMGMHHALSAQVLVLEGGIDRELLVNNFFETLDAESVDLVDLHETAIKMNEFYSISLQPFMSMKQRNAAILSVKPDAELETPVLFDEEFTCEEMSALMGRKMAGELRMRQLPLNRYWIKQAFDDAAIIQGAMAVDEVMQLPVMDMLSLVRSKELSTQIADTFASQSAAWLDNVAKQDGVVALDCEDGERVYYKIHDRGNEVKPTSQSDSLYMEYSLYSCYGMPVESTKEMVAAMDRYIARLGNDATMDDNTRAKLLDEAEAQREIFSMGGATMKSLFFDLLGDCLKQIGEGGSITVWLPASHITNVVLDNENFVYSNMGGVITIKLNRVVPVEQQVARKRLPKPISKIRSLQ